MGTCQDTVVVLYAVVLMLVFTLALTDFGFTRLRGWWDRGVLALYRRQLERYVDSHAPDLREACQAQIDALVAAETAMRRARRYYS